MSYIFVQNRRPGLPSPIDGETIHEAWCSCRKCSADRKRGLKLDLFVIALGLCSALTAVAGVWLLGIK